MRLILHNLEKPNKRLECLIGVLWRDSCSEQTICLNSDKPIGMTLAHKGEISKRSNNNDYDHL